VPESWASSDFWNQNGAAVVSLLAVLVGWAVAEVSHRFLRRIGRRTPLVAGIGRRVYRPAQMLSITLGAQVTISIGFEGSWRDEALDGLLVASIAAGVWLVVRIIHVLIDEALPHFSRYEDGSPEARRLHTQVVILRRLATAVAWVIAIGVILTTFEAVRGLGASMLASAGVLGVVAGLAAQSTLGNIFAGMQLAFGDRLRIGDVVVVEGEWGTIEEMTLGYVVVHIWDQRRLILPSSYFTSNPFVNWTRRDAAILGTVEMDVDWTVPVREMREELENFVRGHPMWDGRLVSLHVTGTTGTLVRVRPLVSAADGDRAWFLRCAVREHLVEWIRTNFPQALPRMRTEWAAGAVAAGGAAGTAGTAGGMAMVDVPPPAIPAQRDAR
jgi:small-conductance mechanosensitive channel